MKGKITPEIFEKMKKSRLEGATLRQIEQQYNVSRWTTIKYLKDVKSKESLSNNIWKQAEKKAVDVLKKYGFTDFLDLNEINPTSYFDIYCKDKNNNKWLIDVTINESKDLVAKSMRLVFGFRCAILYFSHDLKIHKFMELKEIKWNEV
jgi:hypothetical protein